MSHPARGAWIEIQPADARICISIGSHPARGAWIEIGHNWQTYYNNDGRTPPGVRGLKFEVYRQEFADISRTPPGVRGLKSLYRI